MALEKVMVPKIPMLLIKGIPIQKLDLIEVIMSNYDLQGQGFLPINKRKEDYKIPGKYLTHLLNDTTWIPKTPFFDVNYLNNAIFFDYYDKKNIFGREPFYEMMIQKK